MIDLDKSTMLMVRSWSEAKVKESEYQDPIKESPAASIAVALEGTVRVEERKRKNDDESPQYIPQDELVQCDEDSHHFESILVIHDFGESSGSLA